MKRLGLDVGGVIIDAFPHIGTDREFHSDNFLDTPPVEGSIEAIAELNNTAFKDNVFLVSKTSDPERAITWFKHHKFFEKTGIPEDRYHHCLHRDGKVPIVKELGITHFVDDRAEVLSYMEDIVPNIYLFQSLGETEDDFPETRARATFVQSWGELLPLLKT